MPIVSVIIKFSKIIYLIIEAIQISSIAFTYLFIVSERKLAVTSSTLKVKPCLTIGCRFSRLDQGIVGELLQSSLLHRSRLIEPGSVKVAQLFPGRYNIVEDTVCKGSSDRRHPI